MSRLLPAVLLILATVPPAFARDSGRGNLAGDRSSFGTDITVDADTTARHIACAFCSVRLHGNSTGNVAVFFGDVTLDEGHAIQGNVAVFGGDVSLADDAVIDGNLALAGGDLYLAPDASIHGSRAISSSRLWLLIPFLPLLILIGLIWLVVWIVQRIRYRRLYAPPGRGF
jgi:hypothetical protein